MSKVRALVLLTMVMSLAVGVATATGDPFLQGASTPSQTALFIPFVAVDGAGQISTALSVSNVLEAPEGIEKAFFVGDDGLPPAISAGNQFLDIQGTITFYVWAADGTPISWETDSDEAGNGVLDENGELGPGQTFTITLEEILEAVDASPAEDEVLVGYGWVVANFDAVQGTVNVYYPSLGFAQSLNMEPTLGSLGVFAGVPLVSLDSM